MIVFSQPSLLAKNTIIGVGCILNAILSSPNPVTVKTGLNLESTLSLAPYFLFNKDLTLAYRVEGCEMTACASSWVCQSIFRLLRRCTGLSAQTLIPFHPIVGLWQIGTPVQTGMLVPRTFSIQLVLNYCSLQSFPNVLINLVKSRKVGKGRYLLRTSNGLSQKKHYGSILRNSVRSGTCMG